MSEAYLLVFKTITLGQYASLQEYRKALKARRCRLQTLTGQVLDKIEVNSERMDLHLVVLSVAELGPALRLQYLDQPKRGDEVLRIGMKPVHHATGAFIFDLLNIPGPRFVFVSSQLPD